MKGVFDLWVRRDVARVFIQLFDVALAAWAGMQPGLCIFAETCGTQLAMEHNGDLYSCDHFVEPRFRLGNIQQNDIMQLVTSSKQHRFGQEKKTKLPRYCRQCEVRFVCNGGCPKNRFIKTPAGEPGLNYLCEGYKMFFNHVREPMEFMVKLIKQRRPPADIMFPDGNEKRNTSQEIKTLLPAYRLFSHRGNDIRGGLFEKAPPAVVLDSKVVFLKA